MASVGLATRVLTGRAGRRLRRYRTASYDQTPVPTSRERHMLSRMGCGFSVGSFAAMRAAGGELAWFEQQLQPESVTESSVAQQVSDWFPRLQDAPTLIFHNDDTEVHRTWHYARDLANYSVLRRIYSNRTVLESMVELWSNHLHVNTRHFPGFTQRPAYDAMIRRHALGTFEELLVAATLHPAMLMFLDNWKSVRGNPNENHGRELLELHTVGRADHTEDMVKQAAKILSGWTLNHGEWAAFYDPTRHTTGAVDLLGFQSTNAVANDPELARRFLRVLAHHPATAQRIARKLAVRFVSDDPPQPLVDRLAQVFLDSGTDIKATLRALVTSEEFWASAGQKVRTPIDDVVATCRALQVTAQAPINDDSFASRICYAVKSVQVFQWPRPDGPPDHAVSWATTTRMLNSWQAHWGLAGGWYPKGQVEYRAPAYFLPDDFPATGVPFARLVDHLSRVVLGRTSTTRILRAACEGCDIEPTEVITGSHALMRYKFHRLLAVLLDSPAHMTR